MCQFNFIVTENDSPILEIRETARKHGLNFHFVSLKTLNPNILTFSTTINDCDCSSAIGRSENSETDTFDEIGETKKLKRKRFSNSKIENLIREKKQKFEQGLVNRRMIAESELEVWLKFLSEIKKEKPVKRIGVLFRNFKGSFNDEKVNEFETETKRITQEELINLKENELKWFV